MFPKLILICALAIAAWLPAAAAQTQPNIIVIMTDDQDDFASVNVMPAVRLWLKQRGVWFTNSFTNFPVCCPSRASLLSGKAAHNHGVLGNTPKTGGGYAAFIDQEADTLGVWLQAAGYKTAFMGKYLTGYDLHETVVPAEHVPPGWTEWYAMPNLGYVNFTVNENGTVVSYRRNYSTDWLADKAVDFINRRAAAPEPFFLFIGPKAPHNSRSTPAVPAARHRDAAVHYVFPRRAFNENTVSDKPGFVQATPPLDAAAIAEQEASFIASRRSLLAVDEMLERIMQALAQAAVTDNTIVVLTSDNGYLYGEHRLTGKGVVYEESIRVPLLIRGPGVRAGETRNHLVNNLDLVATIVDLAVATPTHTLDGRSLMPIVRNPAASWRTALLVQGQAPGNIGRYLAVRTQSAVYVEHTSAKFGNETEYYDFNNDKHQHFNRAADPDYAGNVTALSAVLAALKNCAGASCWYDAPITVASFPQRPRQPKSAVYRGPLPKLWPSRAEYDRVMRADE